VIRPASISMPGSISHDPGDAFPRRVRLHRPDDGDSLAGSNPYTTFMVVGRNSSGSLFCSRYPDSGYSVDNIARQRPRTSSPQFSDGSVQLRWMWRST